METFKLSDLQRLMSEPTPPCVSVYLPTHRGGDQVLQDAIWLKKLLVAAEDELVSQGQRPVDARALVQPGFKLLDDAAFWKQRSDGLALFLTTRGMEVWRLPLAVPLMQWVGKRFYVKPLFPLVQNGKFYVLAVSQNLVKMYTGNRHELRELPTELLPKNMVEALNNDQPEGLIQMHTGTPQLRGKESGVFHGQGGAPDEVKDELLEYFRIIDRGVQELLRGAREPLVFAGVNYLFPIYRKVNSYPHLWEAAIVGSPALASVAELQEQAVALLRPGWERQRLHVMEQIPAQIGNDRASYDVAEVVVAAGEGRVDAAVVAGDVPLWGRIDPLTGHVDCLPQRQVRAEDLLDRVALETFQHGGGVHVVPQREVPGGGSVAALYRYAAPKLASVTT